MVCRFSVGVYMFMCDVAGGVVLSRVLIVAYRGMSKMVVVLSMLRLSCFDCVDIGYHIAVDNVIV